MEENYFFNRITKRHIRTPYRRKTEIKNSASFISSIGGVLTPNNNESKTKDITNEVTKVIAKETATSKRILTDSRIADIADIESKSSISSNRLFLKDTSRANQIIKETDKDEDKGLSILDINYFQCYLCDQYFREDKLLIKIKCPHKFCYRCGKMFYEEKIEGGQFHNFKCGAFRCQYIIDDSIIYQLISKNHLKVIEEKKATQLEKNSEQSKHEEIIDCNSKLKNYFKDKKAIFLEIYSQKNVLDINSNELFYQYSKNKQLICPKCKEMALYGKNGCHFIKCLNCFARFCKYCLKSYDPIHMDIISNNHCKVYYRKAFKRTLRKGKCLSKLIFIILILIGGFFLISTVFLNQAQKSLRKKNLCLKILFFLFNLILFLIAFPISFLIIPYFPVITSI